MEENVDLKVIVQVQEAEQNLNNLNKTLDETKEKVDDINESVEEGVPTVGGLDKAFESVFNTLSKEGSKGGAVIKKIFDSVKNAIPTVKALNNTAITGLKGIKGAIAATGLGVLVILLGELIAHWDKFSAAIQRWIPFMRQGAEETEALTKANEELIEANKEQNAEIDFQARLMSALGASEKEVINYKIKETQALQAATEAQIAETQAKIESMKAHSWFRRWISGENKQIEQMEESLKALEAEHKRLAGTVVKLNQDLIISDAKAANQRTKVAKTSAKEQVSAAEEAASKIVEAYKKVIDKANPILQTLKDKLDFGRMTEEVKKEWSLLTNIFDDPELGKDLSERVAKIKKSFQDEYNIVQEAVDKEKEMFEGIQGLQDTGDPKDLELYEKAYTAYVEHITSLENAKKVLIIGASKEITEAIGEQLKLRDQLNLDHYERLKQSYYEFQSSLLALENVPEKMRNEEQYKLEQERLKEHKKYLEDLLAMEKEGTEAYVALQEEIVKANQDITLSEAKRAAQRRKEIEGEISDYLSAARSIADIFGSMADILQEDIQNRLEHGKITQEEAEKEFETAKNWQYAETWINTLAGMTAALTSPVMQSMGIPGWIAAAAQAAALLASGIAQTVKIKNTKFGGGSTGGGGSVPSPGVGVTPIKVTDDIQVSPSALAKSQSPADQRVYILEGDIQDSNKRVEIREANSSF